MRERVAVLGGSVETGSRSAGGFRVRARLPLLPPDNALPPDSPLPAQTTVPAQKLPAQKQVSW
jgi:hypothetical protein